MKKTTQNPLLLKDIPIATPENENPGIRVIVDGYSALCYIRDSLSEKIVILFDADHPRWGEYFTTKYYRFIEPGQMLWGHDKEIMEIINMENN